MDGTSFRFGTEARCTLDCISGRPRGARRSVGRKRTGTHDNQGVDNSVPRRRQVREDGNRRRERNGNAGHCRVVVDHSLANRHSRHGENRRIRSRTRGSLRLR